MSRILTILEVSQKQAYIFHSKKLRENAGCSENIRYVTDSTFFSESAGGLYREENNLVYSGGGHTVLEFAEREKAVAFVKHVTEAAIRRFDGLEMFAAHSEYDEDRTPQENLEELTRALEKKKARRRTAFRFLDLGVELLEPGTSTPKNMKIIENNRVREPVEPPEGYSYPSEFEELAGDDNFIAVVHTDGNSMGSRVRGLYESQSNADWDSFKKILRIFSGSIMDDFKTAFSETVKAVIKSLRIESGTLPIRPVILAGDDVCFVTRGSIGLECARILLEKLSEMRNAVDKKPYAACAGVAVVHTKYPFHRAYELSEELCGSAKRFGVSLDEGGGVSAMDWHIEFGQTKDSLGELRQDYKTEDGNRMELRPVTVLTPENVKPPDPRTYRFFRGMCRGIQSEKDGIARTKLKELRSAFKQGKLESRYYLREKEIMRLMEKAFTAEFQSEIEQMEQFREIIYGGKSFDREAFRQYENEKFERCLYFDALEMCDHWEALEVDT